MFVFRKPLFTIIMAPNHKSGDAGSASKPKRSCDVLFISEKVKILDMIEIKKKLYAEIATYGKNKSSIHEVMKNKEKVSLLCRLLRIRLKRQNPLLSCVQERDRERESTPNVQYSVLYNLLLFYLMLVMYY